MFHIADFNCDYAMYLLHNFKNKQKRQLFSLNVSFNLQVHSLGNKFKKSSLGVLELLNSSHKYNFWYR